MKNPLQAFTTGLQGFWRGVAWLMGHPGVFVFLIVPWLMAAAAFAGGMWAFWSVGSPWVTELLMGWFSTWNDHWAWQLLYMLIRALMWFSVLLFCLVTSAVVLGIVSSPIFEIISVKVERDLLGESQQFVVPWPRYPRLILGEVIKAIFVTLLPLMMLLIPGVNIFAGVVAAFLLGWDFYDYPLARRGWSLQERWQFVRSEFWTVLGFGVWLAIPVVQIVFVPMAVAGGTILNVEALKRRGLVAVQQDVTN